MRILNLPLGWMNQQRGSCAMSLIGNVVKIDVDADGEASGACGVLTCPVAIEIDKPLRRGVLLRMSRTEAPRWFEAHMKDSLSTASRGVLWVIRRWNARIRCPVMNLANCRMMYG